MTRGNGKHAKEAMAAGKLSAFIKQSGGQSQAAAAEYVDWSEVDSSLIAGAVSSVNREGGSLLLGHTRDKRSYSVMVFYGTEKTPYYFPCSGTGLQDLNAFLYALASLGL